MWESAAGGAEAFWKAVAEAIKATLHLRVGVRVRVRVQATLHPKSATLLMLTILLPA